MLKAWFLVIVLTSVAMKPHPQRQPVAYPDEATCNRQAQILRAVPGVDWERGYATAYCVPGDAPPKPTVAHKPRHARAAPKSPDDELFLMPAIPATPLPAGAAS